MPNRSIPELSENVSPIVTDLGYVAIRSRLGFYYDRRCLLSNFKKWVVLCKTSKKGASYSVQTSECDKRWMSNQGSSVDISFSLPEASEGYEIGFVVEDNHKVTVAPQATDRINPLGGVGVSVESSTQGSSIYLKGYVGGWLVVCEGGTWST